MTRLANLPLALLLILLSVASICVADTLQELVDQLPQCSKLCMTLWAINVGCSQADIACQCGALPIDTDKTAAACLTGACGQTELNRTYVIMLFTIYVYTIAGFRGYELASLVKVFGCAREREREVDADEVIYRACFPRVEGMLALPCHYGRGQQSRDDIHLYPDYSDHACWCHRFYRADLSAAGPWPEQPKHKCGRVIW
jgi:hypothetical protein